MDVANVRLRLVTTVPARAAAMTPPAAECRRSARRMATIRPMVSHRGALLLRHARTGEGDSRMLALQR